MKFVKVLPLMLVLAALVLSACGNAAEPTLTGTVWQWQQTQMNDGTLITPVDPARYTIEFLEDGTVGIQSDCNRITGTYTVDGNNLTLTLGAKTMAMCPEDTQDMQFEAGLNGVASYFFQDGDLYMDLKFDSGTMKFSE